jgi:protein-disulfide isomerase-like protein with CxxC motif
MEHHDRTRGCPDMTTPRTSSRRVEFFFDPACPFCWQTSKWFRQVERQVEIEPVWRFISLTMLNDEMDQMGEVNGHTMGHQLLRVAAAAKAEHGEQVLGGLYKEMGERIWETALDVSGPLEDDEKKQVMADHQAHVLSQVPDMLRAVGLPVELAEAAEDEQYDAELQASTDEAMERTGGNVGTPILAFGDSDGPAFFGPVISSTPSDEKAVELWDALTTIATFDGFAELKRSMRDPLDNVLLGTLSPPSA